MKHHILVAAFVALSPSFLSGQSGGKDVVMQHEIDLESINGVVLSFSADVFLTQGPVQQIIVESNERFVEHLDRDVNKGIWHIGHDKTMRKVKGVKIRITLPELTEVATSGSGSIVSTNTFTGLDEVRIAISGSGEISLMLEGNTVKAAINGSGDLELEGSAHALSLAISGSGDADARHLRTEECKVAISGSGSAHVYCDESLNAAISGSGDIRYRGNATNIRSAVNGSGDVEKMD
jgi:hypothetical protein